MELRQIGHSKLKVTPLCLGGNVFGWTIDEPASFEVLDAYAELGGNFIDTADVYSTWAPGNTGGESETILGRWMKARNNREKVIIATKCGSKMPSGEGLSRAWIHKAVEDSLRRLQTDHIDLYQSHIDDQSTPLEETMEAFNDLVRAGKVRALGCSNYSGERLQQALTVSERHAIARYECIQPKYNLVSREYETDQAPVALKNNVGCIPYSSLASGFLTGKYKRDGAMPDSKRAGGVQQRYFNDEAFAVLAKVESLAKELNATPAQVSLAWLMQQPSVTAPIASATSVAQLRELMGSLALQLPQGALP
jgi:aryl-alcohol dehydrogenase-like predicted oxidoreductase